MKETKVCEQTDSAENDLLQIIDHFSFTYTVCEQNNSRQNTLTN